LADAFFGTIFPHNLAAPSVPKDASTISCTVLTGITLTLPSPEGRGKKILIPYSFSSPKDDALIRYVANGFA
jgi:hypothetical protein